jgi:hypothetical protein
VIEIRTIRSLSEVPSNKNYVLVMSGISTHDQIHRRGATFVVNDGYLNPKRDADRALALTKARQFASDHKLMMVYVLE